MPEAVRFATKIVLAQADGRAGGGRGRAGEVGDGGRGVRVGLRLPAGPRGPGAGLRRRACGRTTPSGAGFRQVAGEGPAGRGAGGRAGTGSVAGDGAKGPRRYDWAVTRTNGPEPERVRPLAADPAERVGPGRRGVLRLRRAARHDARRSWSRSPGRGGRSRSASSWPRGTAGWTSTRCGAGSGWHRHVTLSLFALAVVAVDPVAGGEAGAAKKGGPRLVRAERARRSGGCCSGWSGTGSPSAERGPGVVGVAAAAPAPGAGVPLPQARGQTARRLTTTVGLRPVQNRGRPRVGGR